MALLKLKHKDILAICSLGLGLLILFFPWQWEVYLINRHVAFAIRRILYILILLPLAYTFYRAKALKKLFMRIIQVGISSIVIVVIALIYLSSFHPLTIQSTYMLLYSSPKNNNETIEIIHRGNTLKSWNELKYVTRYTEYGFWLLKDFKQNKLQGEWIVNKDNPFCKFEGLASFKNGKIIEAD